ncbi:hypothetical protein KKC83_04385 [Patescibacteria group bacterium]|nr:hypothetical protein [Candidatus Falkowbacteria bacterium]MBU3906363.1 hypothetical protein [Patescibacteria group bacterium]MCG2698728.1 hypothetical protein [Candidatus Parcubacteria bacterium]MBU4014644.1 hypothetical protein [Patescibacteria group bacterium]MBU4026753.1 hypothetical protein [Patescibacteria group bacterium]
MQDNNIISSNKKDEIKKEIEMKKKVEEYKDIEGLSTKKLNFGLWYVEHKRHFRLVFIGFLIAVSAATWTYSIYGFAYYIARGMAEDEVLAKMLVETKVISHEYIKQASAQDLKYYPVSIFDSGTGKYDLVIRVENSNQRWWAEISYYFSANNDQTGESSSFILPNGTKHLMALAQDFRVKPANAQLIVKNISWKRVDRHEIADWQAYQDSYLNIAVENIEFIPAGKSKLTEKINLNQANFDVINKTAYNYWQVDFPILLYSGAALVGVNRYSVSELMSGEKRQVQVRWPGNLGRVSGVEAIPELNILRDDIFIKFEGGVGEEK